MSKLDFELREAVVSVYRDYRKEGRTSKDAVRRIMQEYNLSKEETESMLREHYQAQKKRYLQESTKPNISKLYDRIFSIKEGLSDCVQLALEVANDAETFGGEVARVLTGQIRQTLVPGIQSFIDDSANAASTKALIDFLDNVPLAWVRSPVDQRGSTTSVDTLQGVNQPNGSNPTAPAMNTLEPSDTTTPQSAMSQQESKSRVLQNMLKEDWKKEHEIPENLGDALDFRTLVESFRKQPSVPASMEPYSEDRIYQKAMEAGSKPEALKRLDEDILAGPYRIPSEEEIHGMDDWRTMVESTVPLRQMDAGDIAPALMSMNESSAVDPMTSMLKESRASGPEDYMRDLTSGDVVDPLKEMNVVN